MSRTLIQTRAASEYPRSVRIAVRPRLMTKEARLKPMSIAGRVRSLRSISPARVWASVSRGDCLPARTRRRTRLAAYRPVSAPAKNAAPMKPTSVTTTHPTSSVVPIAPATRSMARSSPPSVWPCAKAGRARDKARSEPPRHIGKESSSAEWGERGRRAAGKLLGASLTRRWTGLVSATGHLAGCG